MIRGLMTSLGRASIAALAAVAAPYVPGPHHMGRTRYAHGRRPRYSAYRPHQGKREIARRLAQAERNEQRQRERMDAERVMFNFTALEAETDRMSRRWKPIP